MEIQIFSGLQRQCKDQKNDGILLQAYGKIAGEWDEQNTGQS